LFIIADVEDVKYVINFDYPNTSEDYIHRIGRTGRCNLSGTAYAFFTPNNARQAKELIAVLEEANQAINPKLAELANIARSTFGGKGSYTCFHHFLLYSGILGLIFSMFS
jgi:superfamily II DNA/RNA helicase